MALKVDNISEIIVKYIKGKCTDQELNELDRWVKSDPRNKTLLENLLDSKRTREKLRILNKFDVDKAWERVLRDGVVSATPRRLISWPRLAMAMGLLLFGGIAFLYMKKNQPKEDNFIETRVVNSTNPKYKNDVLPAIEGATLVLANGDQIALSEAISVQEDGSVLNENSDRIADLEIADEPIYHELVVPQTNYFSFQLSDGTKVWVNANSKLSFPSRFIGDERKVRLIEGEAYFEVAKREGKPFIVETSKANVKVLGTQFNVRNYQNNFTATLAEGKVEVYTENSSQELKPMQKAYFRSDNLVMGKADLTKDLSWKNNTFYFKNDNLKNVMQQIENWYGVRVQLDRSLANGATYSGEIRRDVPLSEMLDMLEFTSGLVFSVEGTKLYIRPKKV